MIEIVGAAEPRFRVMASPATASSHNVFLSPYRFRLCAPAGRGQGACGRWFFIFLANSIISYFFEFCDCIESGASYTGLTSKIKNQPSDPRDNCLFVIRKIERPAMKYPPTPTIHSL